MSMNQSMVVQKYGGSSLANTAKIKAVAQYIKNSLHRHQRVCVVVSAMGHTTNDLIKLAYEVNPKPIKREMDMLISCGERCSMALLAMALHDIGVSAISFTGSQSGIITNNHHRGAEIKEIHPHRVLKAFDSYEVVIIAGFQGVSYDKEITTLKRGGSDTTAIAMAAALQTQAEIYTDVLGMMDADPHIISHAQLIDKLSLDQSEALALYGARILAYDAILLAKKWQVNIRLAQSGEAIKGSLLTKDEDPNHVMTALTHLRGVMSLAFPLHDPKYLGEDYFLCGHLQQDHFLAYVSNDLSQDLIDPAVINHKGLALITVHLSYNHKAYHALLAIKDINNQGLVAFDVIVGYKQVFIIVMDEHLHSWLNLLYAAINKENGA